MAPGEAFDAVLALLSAASYSRRFAEDLEDAFPSVPFPREAAAFDAAVAVGAELRAVQTYARPPGAAFATARVAASPPAQEVLARAAWEDGALRLNDGAVVVTGVAPAARAFAVSGYAVLPRWLEHRVGRVPIDAAFLTALLDLAGRVAEVVDLSARADAPLAAAVAAPLTRADLGMG